MGGAAQHGKAGITRVAIIAVGHRAPQKAAATIAHDETRVAAAGAKPGLSPWLPGPRRIVHHECMFTSEATTRGVRVAVVSEFSPTRSRIQDRQWFFLYTITITNDGSEPVQLLSRHWIITDDVGRVEEVKGPGVVGEQPVLGPTESYTYTSGCPLSTPFGLMEGTYQMVTGSGENFDVKIAPFTLSEPYTVH